MMVRIFKKENIDKALMLRLGAAFVLLICGIAIPLTNTVKLCIFIAGWLIAGYEVVIAAVAGLFRGGLLNESFLMSIASVGAFVTGNGAEGLAVILFYQIGEFFSDMAVDSSRDSISELMDLRPDSAHMLKDGEAVTLHPQHIPVGSEIVIYPGERIPMDGCVCLGASDVDTSSMTGEAQPIAVEPGDEVLCGYVNGAGTLRVTVEKEYGMSAAARILELVTDIADKKAPSERFITSFARIYTPIVVGCAALLAILPPLLFGGLWSTWVYRALTFLVISCPCALVISVPLGFFAGIGKCARQGILIKGGNVLERLAKADTVVFDKTGTLTSGHFSISGIYATDGVSAESLLSLAAQAEQLSTHPLAQSLRAACPDVPCHAPESFCEQPGKGVMLSSTSIIAAGNAKLMLELGVLVPTTAATSVHVALDGRYMGHIEFSDTIRAEAAACMRALRQRGTARLFMLTGDSEQSAEQVADALELTGYSSRLSPVDKVIELEKLKSSSNTLLYVGDGTNDAPVLAASDVGFAMGLGGTDSAIEAADVVLLGDDPYSVVRALDASRRTLSIVWQNIVVALSIKAVILVLGALGFASMWLAVFADVGVALLAVLNSLRALK
ncbi:MAG: heavy metal translocating P-type ATPase [Clostridia bacterium]